LGDPRGDPARYLFSWLPDAYFQAQESKAPVVSQRYQAKTQLDQRLP
jgi:hypothetical protein